MGGGRKLKGEKKGKNVSLNGGCKRSLPGKDGQLLSSRRKKKKCKRRWERDASRVEKFAGGAGPGKLADWDLRLQLDSCHRKEEVQKRGGLYFGGKDKILLENIR